MAAPVTGPTPASDPPGRALLRLAGVLTQLTGAVCLLIGTIALVLVQQSKTGGAGAVIGWLLGAMAGLVVGGLAYRGGLVRLLLAAAIDATFAIVLLVLDVDTLRALLKILPASDVETIAHVLVGAAIAMFVAAAACLAAIPQGIRFARWFANAAAASRSAMTATSTARGFPPPPVPARGSMMVMPDEEPASRRRLYMALGGLAIGVGAGIGVLVSSTAKHEEPTASVPATPATKAGGALPHHPPDAGTVVMQPTRDAGTTVAETPVAPTLPTKPTDSAQSLVAAEHAAIAKLDKAAFAQLLAPNVFGFGIDGGEVAEGRDAVVAQILRDLGGLPATGLSIDTKALQIGDEMNHAWIAEDLELSAPDQPVRRLVISSLAVIENNHWSIVALHWAAPVADPVAERLAILGTLPVPKAIADRHDGPDDLDAAVHAAFASRSAFADAFGERPDGFNFGSGGERAKGGSVIKRIFGKLHAQIRMHDGARVVAGSAWDKTQAGKPWIGFAALNVDYTAKTRAATDVTQTFRVLAILVKEPGGWKIVQTQWSNAGPVSDR